MKPPFSVIIFTTLAGMAQGLFVVVALTQVVSINNNVNFYISGGIVALLLLIFGMIASLFHLGHPLRAWRAISGWRTSWLSREVIVLPLLMVVVFIYSLVNLCPNLPGVWFSQLVNLLAISGTVLVLLLFICTGMIYASLKFLQEWHSPFTVLNFILLGLASGFLLASSLSSFYLQEYTRGYLYLTVVVLIMAFVNRSYLLWRNRRLRKISTIQTALGINNLQIRQISSGAIAPTFNHQQFNHGKSHYFIRSIKWLFLFLGFVVPLLLMLTWVYNPCRGLLPMTLLIQFSGLLLERWYFFAEANHPQNIYYQVIA